ncbi:hypothetical protein, partial [Clostridium sp.]|uniref:hypothetical protein n=1 Tax=Clostridium sp. TaxID=1506 RepID=UPI003F319299
DLIPTNSKYFKICLVDNNNPNTNLQIEYGTQATPYEPYQEDKLTILSPVQLEKGDVLKEVDGVWGVEKNLTTVLLNGQNVNDSVVNRHTNTLIYQMSNYDDLNNILTDVICSRFKSADVWGIDSEGIQYYGKATSHKLKIGIPKNLLGGVTLQDARKFMYDNNVIVKIPTSKSQFIPLPHAQQVKLRTFSNKTNISSLCANGIEPTIKGDVPKSISATVNTHTAQIDSLNKELDRVKKLEESTVSTVVTDKDFVSVEETSQGYFEGLELKGRTLNSLFSIGTPYKNVSNGNLCIPYSGGVLKENATLGNKCYFTNFNSKKLILDIYENKVWKRNISINGNSKVDFQLGTNEYLALANARLSDGWTDGDLNSLSNSFVVLDTNDDVDTYFEGIASVGDGTDEIVVSSVDGDGNLFDDSALVGLSPISNNTISSRLGFKLQSNKTYTIRTEFTDGTYIDPPNFVYNFVDKNNKAVLSNIQVDGRVLNFTEQVCSSAYSIQIYWNGVGDFSSKKIKRVQILKSTTPFYEFKEYKADKKRLLRLNAETQVWEKPILREWDTVEKHSDDKYYYHERSGQVVLDGSVGFIDNGTHSETHMTFYTTVASSIMNPSSPLVCDKFQNVNTVSSNFSIEGIFTTSIKYLYITISKSRLVAQDVNGFKSWLQANPVTVVYQLAQEKVYECTNIDLITYQGETNFMVKSGVLSPNTVLSYHGNISNVVTLLQKKVSILESNISKYMTTQNRMMLGNRYSADTSEFRLENTMPMMEEKNVDIDYDLYTLLLSNISIGKDNYNRNKMEEMLDFYVGQGTINWDMWDELFLLIELQHNPIIEEVPSL